MPILVTVFSTPDDPSFTEMLVASLANELVDSAPAVSADPEDPDDELEDGIPSSVGPVH